MGCDEQQVARGHSRIVLAPAWGETRMGPWTCDEALWRADELETAVARRGDVAGCIFHSDRGSQFRARKFHRALNRHGLAGSMGNVGTAADNAAMESFFALLQKNVLNTRRWATRDELRVAIITWIERTYHRRRRQTALGRLTPTEYETIMTNQTGLAA